MKRAKKLYVLLGVLAVVCALTFAVSKYEEKKELIKNSEEVILTLDADTVTRLSWEYEDVSLTFLKNEEWQYEEDEAFPVDETKIQELLKVFQEFGVSFIIEEVQDYSAYGLDDPECTITIETEEKTYEIALGDFSVMDSKRYVSIGDGNAYLVKEDPMDVYEITLEDMIRNDEIPELEKAETIEFSGTQNYTLTYEEDSTDSYCADDVYFTMQNGKKVPADTDNVESYLNTISSLTTDEYASYDVTEEELAAFGLNNPELSVTVAYLTDEESQETFVLHLSRDPEEAAAAAEEAASDEEEETITAYARVGESQIVYKLDGDSYQALMEASYDDLRHQEVLSADFAEITQIDLTLEGEDYTITTEEKDDAKTYFYGEEELEIYELKTSLNTLYAEEFTDEKPSGKEEISVTVHLDNENFPQISMKFYRCDGEKCLAVVDGESVCFVKRSDVVDMIEAVNAIVLQ